MKVYIGTTREKWEGSWMQNPGGYVLCRCGSTLYTVEEVRAHYDMGHFDTPQYLEIPKEEIIERAAQKLVDLWTESIERKNLYTKYGEKPE